MRTEPLIHQLAISMDVSGHDGDAQWEKIFSYYLQRYQKSPLTSLEQKGHGQREYLIARVLALVRQHGQLDKMSPLLVTTIANECGRFASRMEKGEVEALWNIAQTHSSIFNKSNIREVVSKYLFNSGTSIGGGYAHRLIVGDNGLQRYIIEALQSNHTRDYIGDLLRESTEFRIRAREVDPSILLEFKPWEIGEDKQELVQLLKNSPLLTDKFLRMSRLFRDYEPNFTVGKSDARKVYNQCRDLLRAVNPSVYKQLGIKKLGEHELLRRFDELYHQLLGK